MGGTVTFAVSREAWESRKEDYINYSTAAYLSSGLSGIILLYMLAPALLGMILAGKGKPWRNERICAVTLEFLVCLGMALIAGANIILQMAVYVASGRAGGAFSDYLGIHEHLAGELAMALNIAVLTLFSFCCWYVGLCARALPELGIREYIRQRSLIYRFFPFVKRKVVEFYDSMAHMDLTKDSNRTIINLLLGNGVILFLISCFWIGGFAITLVYSVVLYFILRKNIS